MSSRRHRSLAIRQGNQASVFAALGDKRRLRLVSTLCGGDAQSISQLTAGSNLTRQAITKHLRVLERAGVSAFTCAVTRVPETTPARPRRPS